MYKLFIRLSLLFCFKLFCLPVSAADSLLEMTTDYETFFRQLIIDRNYPGAAFAIVSRDQILHIATVGHTTAARIHPIDQQTTFRLASVSKPFAAEVVGLLVEDGMLDWNDPVTRFLPDFKIDGDA